MAQNLVRNYGCKDEELPVMCNLLSSSLKRDFPSFTGFSPKFSLEYVASFETKTSKAFDLVQPKAETVILKTINGRLYKNMDNLISPINYVVAYIGMVDPSRIISPNDFGLTGLRNSLFAKDPESVIKHLRTVKLNLINYQEVLTEQGLKSDLTEQFNAATALVTDDKTLRYEINSNRSQIVQDNRVFLNELYAQFTDIMKVGKTLFKTTDPVKLKNYTLSEIKKHVRRTFKPEDEAANGIKKETISPEQ